MSETSMTEEQARADLRERGVWRMAPGLWCDRTVPDFIAVADEHDTALGVRRALEKSGNLPHAKSQAQKTEG